MRRENRISFDILIGRSIMGIYKSLAQTHECGNWDCGRAVPFLGIFVSNFRYWFFAVCGGRLEGGLTHAALKEAWYLCSIILKEMSSCKACIVKRWIDCMCHTMSYIFF